MAEQHSMIELQGIIKRFYIGQPNELEILHGIDLKVNRGEFVSIVGSSGSGKTTMMNIIGILDRPTEGEYMLDGVDVAHAKDRDLSMIRNKKIGFVFQTYNLISRTSALKNVELPMLYAGIGKKERTERAKELLNMVGMGERMSHTPDELSGGQKQRVAIARAMANEPSIILADEPTGALDSKTGRMIMDIFHRLNEEQGKTIVLITHSQELAEETQRIVTLKDCIIIGENILLALNGLRANKMRSLLTMLGIIIGIASVIAIMTLGDSISSSVTDSMASMGANNITVGVSQKSTSQETTSSGMTFSMGPRFTKMTEDDYISDEMLDSLEERYGDSIQGFSLTESVGSGTAQLGSLYAYVNATGVNEANLENTDLTLLAGRTLTERDQIEAKKVCLVSDYLVNNLFNGNNMAAVGQTVDVLFNSRYYTYTIVGVYKYEESDMGF